MECWDGGPGAVEEGQAGQVRWRCLTLHNGDILIIQNLVSDDVVDSLWVRITEMENKDVAVGVYC